MDFGVALDRIGSFKAVALLTMLVVTASVVMTWFTMTVTGHPMVRTAWFLSATLPLLLVPLASYKIVDLFLRLNRMEQRFRKLSTTDALTETLNRRAFMELAVAQFAQCKAQHRNVSVLILDVDHFRRLNNEHGIGAGDQVLRAVSRTCRGAIHRGDLLARFGSEALILFLPDTSRERCEQFAEQLRQCLASTTVAHEGLLLRLTVSIGTSSSEHEQFPGSLEDLMTGAEAALSLAKAGGRNRVEVVEAEATMRPALAPMVSGLTKTEALSTGV